MESTTPSSSTLPEIPLAELNRAQRDLEETLAPYRVLIMQLYTNVLLGGHPTLALSLLSIIYILISFFARIRLPWISLASVAVFTFVGGTQLLNVSSQSIVRMLTTILDRPLHFSPQRDNTAKLLTFHEICGLIVHVNYNYHVQKKRWSTMKRLNPFLYTLIVSIICLVFFVVGMMVRGLILVYLVVTLFLTLPALLHYRIFNKILLHARPTVISLSQKTVETTRMALDKAKQIVNHAPHVSRGPTAMNQPSSTVTSKKNAGAAVPSSGLKFGGNANTEKESKSSFVEAT